METDDTGVRGGAGGGDAMPLVSPSVPTIQSLSLAEPEDADFDADCARDALVAGLVLTDPGLLTDSAGELATRVALRMRGAAGAERGGPGASSLLDDGGRSVLGADWLCNPAPVLAEERARAARAAPRASSPPKRCPC
jgi:hypothetical protein